MVKGESNLNASLVLEYFIFAKMCLRHNFRGIFCIRSLFHRKRRNSGKSSCKRRRCRRKKRGQHQRLWNRLIF